MPHWLILTDTHFTDSSQDEYRWQIFPILEELAKKYKIDEILHLGDCVDKKDNHGRILVNRLVEAFSHLQSFTNTSISVLSGNHDAPTSGPYYWKFLNKLGIRYIQKPELYKSVLLLPFTHHPEIDWHVRDLEDAKAVFMHQCVDGVVVENDRVLTSGFTIDSVFPKIQIPIYSGDIHRPQIAGGVFYIGTPHPVKFSETWENRVIVVKNDDFHHPVIIPVNSTRRAILDITSSKELEKTTFKSGDQIRVRFHLSGKDLTLWPDEQEKIKAWSKERDVAVVSVEAILSGNGVKAETKEKAQQLELMQPSEVVEDFGTKEKLSQELISMGKEIVQGL